MMWAPVWLSRTLVDVGLALATTLVVLLPDGRVRYPRERLFIAGVWIVVAFPTLVVLSNQFVTTSEFSFEALGGIRNGLFIHALEPLERSSARCTHSHPWSFWEQSHCSSSAIARLPTGSRSRSGGSSSPGGRGHPLLGPSILGELVSFRRRGIAQRY